MGIISICPQKSFIMILHRNETINRNDGLQLLANTVRPRQILGTFNSLNVSGVLKQTESYMEWYNKFEHNGKTPKTDIHEKIINYLRVFHSDCYKIIPQFELRTVEGEYYNDRFAFLEQFMFMVRNLSNPHDQYESPHT